MYDKLWTVFMCSLAFDFSSVDKIHGLLCSDLSWFPVFSLCLRGEALVVSFLTILAVVTELRISFLFCRLLIR